MIPDGNNVYGLLTAANGLEPVLNAVKQAFAGSRSYIYRSQYNGAETLHVRSESVEFESDPLNEGNQHLFNGAVGGSLEEVASAMQALSDFLSKAKIEHSFEIYDGDQRLLRKLP